MPTVENIPATVDIPDLKSRKTRALSVTEEEGNCATSRTVDMSVALGRLFKEVPA